MSITKQSKLFSEYDKILAAIYCNIFSRSKDNQKIILADLDSKSNIDKCIYQLALSSSGIYHFPIYIQCHPFKFIWLKLHKHFRHIHYISKKKFISETIKHRTYGFPSDISYVLKFYPQFTIKVFDDIYEAFYGNH